MNPPYLTIMPISIHAPRAGSDKLFPDANYTVYEFQSTLPVRGATVDDATVTQVHFQFQSTLPVRGATLP